MVVNASARSSYPEVLLEKGILKICNEFTGEHPYRSMISIKLFCNFIEITLRHGCSPVSLLHFFRMPFLKNTSGWLLLVYVFNLHKKWSFPLRTSSGFGHIYWRNSLWKTFLCCAEAQVEYDHSRIL